MYYFLILYYMVFNLLIKSIVSFHIPRVSRVHSSKPILQTLLFPTFSSNSFSFKTFIHSSIMSSFQKPVIAVDIDEVLAFFIPTLANFHNEVYGGEKLTSESFVSYDFHNVWGGSVAECYAKVML